MAPSFVSGSVRRLAAVVWTTTALALVAPTAWAQAQFRGDARHLGVASSAAPDSEPELWWHFSTGGRIVSSPVWSDGLVIFGSDDGLVRALDARTGSLRWAWRTNGPVPSTPAVADGRVHVLSYDGRLHTLDATTGEPLWRFATGGERRFEARGLHGATPRGQTMADPYDVFLSSPAVAGGRVYVGSSDGHLYALDAATGALRWKQATGDVVHASPAVEGGRVVVGSWDGRLYCFDAVTGAPAWRFQAGVDPLMHNQQGFQSSPAIADGVVVVGGRDSQLYAIDLTTGLERWRFSTGSSWVVGSPAVAHGRVYFATSDSSLVHALDVASGRPVFQQQAQAYMFSSPVVAGQVLLIGQLNGTLQARDGTTGSLLWQFTTDAARRNAGWVLTADGRFNSAWLFDSDSYESMVIGFHRQSSVGSFFSTPLVVDGAIYIGSADGRMYALRQRRRAAAQP